MCTKEMNQMLSDMMRQEIVDSNSGWIALKHPTDKFGEWSISPKSYFEEHGHIPDGKANLNVPNMEEAQDHTLTTLDGTDGRNHLKAAGIEIADNPVWFFEKSNYKQAE